MPFLSMLINRVVGACTTLPSANDWIEAGTLLLLLILIAFPFGWRTGFLSRQFKPLPPRTAVGFTIVSFFSPAMTEEIVFRVLPVPHPTESAGWQQKLLWSAISLIVFVLYHPVRTWLLPTQRNRVFLDRRFLVLSGQLGLFCTIAYLNSGSLWPSVLIHWLFVAVWLVLLGGYQCLHSPKI
jgi:predicted Abi (CAAX) family protease